MRAEILAICQALNALVALLAAAGDLETAEEFALILLAVYGAAKVAETYVSRYYFTRPDLLWADSSPWAQVRKSGRQAGFHQIVAMDLPTMTRIYSFFPAPFKAQRARDSARRGRRNNLDAFDVLALTLAWYSSCCRISDLELIFGCTHSVIQRDLAIGMTLLLEALVQIPEAQVVWPSFQVMEEFARAIDVAYYAPPIPGRWFGWVDCLRLATLTPDTTEEQARLYNGWFGGVNVLNLFVFAPNGKIIYRSRNHHGHSNDMGCAAFLQQKLCDPLQTPPGYAIIGDVGFYSHALERHIDTKRHPATYVVAPELWAAFAVWLTSSRQAVEWGMRMLQSTWRRLSVPLPAYPEQRVIILDTVVLLHNLCAHHAQNNQIRSTYIEAVLRQNYFATVPPVAQVAPYVPLN